MTRHTHTVPHFAGDSALLAQEIGDLYYDALADFLHLLAQKIEADGQADAGRQRLRLSAELAACARHLEAAASNIDAAWAICRPFIDLARKAAKP